MVEVFYVAEGEKEVALEGEGSWSGGFGGDGVAEGEGEADLGVEVVVVEGGVVPDFCEFGEVLEEEDDGVFGGVDAVEGRGDLDEARVLGEGGGFGAMGDDGDLAIRSDVVDWEWSA